MFASQGDYFLTCQRLTASFEGQVHTCLVVVVHVAFAGASRFRRFNHLLYTFIDVRVNVYTCSTGRLSV